MARHLRIKEKGLVLFVQSALRIYHSSNGGAE